MPNSLKKDDPLYHPKRKAKWYADTRETRLVQMRAWRKRTREAAMEVLGRICVCCGETEPTMLEIDHRITSGRDELRSLNGNNFAIYQKIARGDAAPGEYQTLCANCNKSKYHNGGECAHKNLRGEPPTHVEFP